MVALPRQFNTADVPDDEFQPIPAGVYTGVITESEMKATNDGTGAYIQLKIELENGRVLFERLNIQNKNETAMKIAYQTLAKICEACGKSTISDTNELHNKRMKLQIEIEKGKPYMKDGEEKPGRDQNVIKKWMPYAQETPAAAATANKAPWAQ